MHFQIQLGNFIIQQISIYIYSKTFYLDLTFAGCTAAGFMFFQFTLLLTCTTPRTFFVSIRKPMVNRLSVVKY